MIFLLKLPMLNRVLAQAALAAAKPWESGTGSLRWCSTMLHKPVAVSQCLAGQISGFLSSMDYQNIQPLVVAPLSFSNRFPSMVTEHEMHCAHIQQLVAALINKSKNALGLVVIARACSQAQKHA